MNFLPGSCVEVFNNVFYNAQSEFAEIWESRGGSPVSIVANSFVAGPATSARTLGISRQSLRRRLRAYREKRFRYLERQPELRLYDATRQRGGRI